jgi:hypothetical protein
MTRDESEPKEQRDDMTQGKGRKDEVGHSGVYPPPPPEAPDDAEVIMPGEMGHRTPEQRR